MGLEAASIYYPEFDEKAQPSEEKSTFIVNKTDTARREVIKVIAVGGGGGNALNHIICKGIEGVELIAVNTDVRDLEKSKADKKLVLGEGTTRGLGAGAIPDVGEKAARETLSEIREYLRGADMVYLAAGMGGGTGTGAVPVIAQAAKEMGILTVAVITKPFTFEGGRRKRYAEAGIKKLREHVDALIVVPNDRLLELSDKKTPYHEAFAMADEVLRQAVQGVTDLVTHPGMVNVDFADLKTVMKEAGTAVMGIGSADGEERISKALKQAVESPLMESSMQGARGVLMNITCGSDLGIFEIQQAAAYIEGIIAEDSTFVWGCVEDEDYNGRVEIVVVATGFDDEAAVLEHKPAPAYRPAQEQKAVRYEAPVQAQREAAVDTASAETALFEQPDDVAVTPVRTVITQKKAPAWLTAAAPEAKPEQPEKAGLFEQKSSFSIYDAPTFTRAGREPRRPQLS